MAFSRRDFLRFSLTTIGLYYLAGCESNSQVGSNLPGEPVVPRQPSGTAPTAPRPSSSPGSSTPNRGTTPLPGKKTPPQELPSPKVTAGSGPIRAIPRSSWAKAPPIGKKLLAMEGISMITVHHEGWTPVYFSDTANTATRLEAVRKGHLERLGAGDIGYHYVVDRGGRVWQGRDVRYQGAHVREHNPHNIGVMCLGNFDVQRPTDAQCSTLKTVLSQLMKQYRVPVKYVYTHQELNPTECPGTAMQSHMVRLRRNGIA